MSPHDPRRGRRPLVFDLDGTLIDSRRDIAAACNHALKETGRDELPEATISGFVGRGAKALLKDVLGQPSRVELLELLKLFQAYYRQHPTEHNGFMAGAEQVLEMRKERFVALCTNKPLFLTEAVLNSLGWRTRFDAIVAPTEDEKKKPDPEPLLRVAEALQVEAQSLIMIGDAPPDVGAGKAVGAHTIGVRGGFLSEELLVAAGPDVILDDLTELGAYLKRVGL